MSDINIRKDLVNLLLSLLDTDITEEKKDEVEKELKTITKQVGTDTMNEWVDGHYGDGQ